MDSMKWNCFLTSLLAELCHDDDLMTMTLYNTLCIATACLPPFCYRIWQIANALIDSESETHLFLKLLKID